MMVARMPRVSALSLRWRTCRFRLERFVDRLSVLVRDRHAASPAQIGHGQHDCALSSLYWAVPAISESEIIKAFNLAADTWPYGGVTNKEFAIALKYLKVESRYSTGINALGALLDARLGKCVALLDRHFIPIVDGKIAGRDAHRHWSPETHVYCHWTLKRRSVRPVQDSRRNSSGSA